MTVHTRLDPPAWIPTREAALARLKQVDPHAYGRTRNFIDGAVTRLSPWLTHGILEMPEVVQDVRARHRVTNRDKLLFELGWREYFQHVWRHLGDGILEDIRSGLPGVAYARAMPPDVVGGATGVPVIDASVRELYATGWLHNHQRMWLASYLVHLRKVHWRTAADWMYAHLLDGDLASNHLSWQWCAGTFSSKPYLFNAENVAKYAPAWASPGTVIDRSYAELEAVARTSGAAGSEPVVPPAVAPPPLFDAPVAPGIDEASREGLAGRRVALIHPWTLRRPEGAQIAIGVIHAPFHRRFPWSARRWSFVMDGMRPVVDRLWIGDVVQLDALLADAASVTSVATHHPGYREALSQASITARPALRFLADPDPLCASFSKFWDKVSGSG